MIACLLFNFILKYEKKSWQLPCISLYQMKFSEIQYTHQVLKFPGYLNGTGTFHSLSLYFPGKQMILQ